MWLIANGVDGHTPTIFARFVSKSEGHKVGFLGAGCCWFCLELYMSHRKPLHVFFALTTLQANWTWLLRDLEDAGSTPFTDTLVTAQAL